jgi:hypothetical protein
VRWSGIETATENYRLPADSRERSTENYLLPADRFLLHASCYDRWTFWPLLCPDESGCGPTQ